MNSESYSKQRSTWARPIPENLRIQCFPSPHRKTLPLACRNLAGMLKLVKSGGSREQKGSTTIQKRHKPMANRRLLRRQLRQAWVDTIRETYGQQIINSERALQVQLAARLLAAFDQDGVRRYLFVEPKLILENGQRVHPDLLVCNSRQIIGAIELKYQPKVRPRYAKDLATLDALARESGSIQLENTRYRGPGLGERGFTLSADPLFVWAGVYRSPRQEIPADGSYSINTSQLLILHAVTQVDEGPEIYAQSGSRLSEY